MIEKNCENCANGWERIEHSGDASWIVYGCPFLSCCDCTGKVFPDHWKEKNADKGHRIAANGPR